MKGEKILLLGSGALRIGQAGDQNVDSIISPEIYSRKYLILKLLNKFMEKEDKKIVHFWDFPNTVRINLTKKYCEELFDRASHEIGLKQLANELKISYPYLLHLRKHYYSIPKDLLIQTAELAQENLETVEKNISSIQARSGYKINVKLPLKSNSKIASLIGHVFGDGCIGSKKRYFEYSNTKKELLKDVEKKIFENFNIKPFRKVHNRIIYSTILGDVLLCFGAPIAPKIYSKSKVPSWIMNSSKEIKKEFIKALFDDDGSVMLSKNYKAKGINLHQTRHIYRLDELISFLNNTKEILESFGINPGKPKIVRKYEKEDGTHVVGYINITDHHSILNYYKKIGFCHKNKNEKISEIINREITYCKFDEQRLMNTIKKIFTTKEILSTKDVSTIIKRDTQTALKKLTKLEKEGIICKVGRVADNRSYLWSIMGGETISDS